MHCRVFQRKFIIEALSSRVPSALKYGEVSVRTWVLPPPFVEFMTVSAAASFRFNSHKNRNTTDIRARPNHVIPANQVAAKKKSMHRYNMAHSTWTKNVTQRTNKTRRAQTHKTTQHSNTHKNARHKSSRRNETIRARKHTNGLHERT